MLLLLMDHQSSTTKVSWRSRHVKRACLGVFAVVFTCGFLPASGQTTEKNPASAAEPSVTEQKPPSEQTDTTQQATPGAVANSTREQLARDCATLLKLSKELKIEIKKAGPDTLSLAVIRKSEEIQKLAHRIQEEMRRSIGTN